MAGKRILTTRALANMITADDVYTADDKLVIPAETVITDDIIAALKEYSIFAIRVKVGEDGQTPIMYGETDASEEVNDEAEESFSEEKAKDNAADDEAEEEDEQLNEEDEQLKEEDEQLKEEDINKIIDILNSSNGQNEVDTIMQLGGLTASHSEESTKDNGYIRTQDTEEFKVFNKVYLDSIDSLKNTFNNVVMKNEQIDKDAILEDVQNVVSKSRNSIHIIDMLQCMRGYNDVTYVHSMNVALLSNMIGRIIYPDIRDEELDVLTLAGLLHDIGKMMIPDEIINKKGRLTESEYNIVKTHVLHGNNILKNLNLDPRIAEVAMRHHERCDGSGYPGGYRREQTEPFARIVAIADTYDAMTSDRVYRPAICPFDVIHMFEREGIIKYDTEYLLPFLEKAVQAYINTDVKLTTDEIGRVIMINQNRFSRPIVKVGNEFYDLSEKENANISIDKVIM